MASIYERGLFTVSSNLPGQNMPHQPPAKPSRAIKYLGVRPLSNRGGLDNSEHYTWLESMLLKGPLAQRAWCMQERYLSPVILHIFDQRYWIWECNHHIRAYNQQGRLFRSDVSDQTLPRRKNTFIPGSTPSPEAVHNLWFKMVEDYSRRQLSFISDKLPAISGMASKLQPLIKAEYLAGMWSNDIESFLWQTDNDMPRETWERVVRRPHRIYWDDPVNGPVKLKNSAAYIAPSWSWASRLTGVSWSMKPMVEESFRVFIPMATIIRHSVDTVRSDKFGHVLAGSSITLDSYLVDAPTHIKPGDLIDGLAGGDTLRTKLQLTLWYLIIGIEQRRRFGERLWRNNPYSLLGLVLTSAGTPELFHRVGVFNSPFEDYHDNGMMVDPVDVPSLIASIGERIIVEVV
jgi:hypothetical protein